jgi:hypothetical protein
MPRLAVKRPVVIGDACWSNAEIVARLRLLSILTFNLSSLHMHLYGSNSHQYKFSCNNCIVFYSIHNLVYNVFY